MSEIHSRDLVMLAAQLREWAHEYDPHVHAAVGLLIDQGTWLGRVGFTRVCKRRHGRTAPIGWAAARQYADPARGGSASKLARPDPAVALGEILYRLSTIGQADVGLIAAAVARAVGVDR